MWIQRIDSSGGGSPPCAESAQRFFKCVSCMPPSRFLRPVKGVLMDIFLQKNGWEIAAPEEEAYSLMIDLASGKLTRAQLSRWLKEHSARLRRVW
jgi:hypothetical protein